MRLSKTRLRTVKSIMTVVLFTLLLTSLILSYLMYTHSRNTFENYHTMSAFVQNSLDAQLQSIRRYSLFFELNSTSNDTVRKMEPYPKIPDSLYRLSLEMLNYQLITPIVDDVFIYYPGSSFVIGNIGCYPADSYTALYSGLRMDKASKWIKAITEAPTELSVLQGPVENSLYYIRKMGPDTHPTGYIVFILNTEKLVSSFSREISPDIHNFQLSLMADGIPLNLDPMIERLLYDDNIPSGMNHIINHGSLQVHINQSSFKNLAYISSYDLGESYRSIRILLILCIAGMLLILLIAFFISMYISASSNKPLNDLMLKVGGFPDNLVVDEYEMINAQFDKLLDNNLLSISKMQTQQDNLDSLYLLILLSPSISSEEEAFLMAKRFDIMMHSQYYYSVVFSSLQDFSQINYDLFFLYISNLGYECWAVIREGKFILILHTDEKEDVQVIAENVIKVRDWFFSKYQTKIAISPCCDSLLCIKEHCYFALEYLSNGASADSPVFLAEVMEGENSLAPQLKQAISDHDNNQISQLLDLLFRDQKTISFIQGQTFATLFNAFFAEHIIDCEVLPDDHGDYWKSTFFSALPYCSKEQKPKEKSRKKKSIALQAKEIIDHEYTDYYLGLYKLAEQLSVSNSYLSSTFKETFGIGIVQYTNKLRIQLAKQMILSTDKSIKGIALETGFSSDISFIRVFKRYEKKTPGNLRK